MSVDDLMMSSASGKQDPISSLSDQDRKVRPKKACLLVLSHTHTHAYKKFL